MRTAAFAIAAIFAAEAAIACVCIAPQTVAEKREMAARIASEAAAVAEIEQVEPMDSQAMRAELYRVHKVHVGKAPREFRLKREFERGGDGGVTMTMTSCDVIPPPGERTTVVLYASSTPGAYRIGGTCDHLFITSPGAVELVREAARGSSGERG